MKSILFNTEMVRAILDGRKTCTRRVVKFRPGWNPKWTGYIPDGPVLYGSNNIPAAKAPYRPGDILYVRETWAYIFGRYVYLADYEQANRGFWRPSIHMPREAARLFLKVKNVRVEQLQDIDDEGVVAEGLNIGDPFDELWDRTIKYPYRPRYGWAANPWVWVIAFERISKEEAMKNA